MFSYEVENRLKKFITETLQKENKNSYDFLESKKLLIAFLSDMMRGFVPPPDRESYKQVSHKLIQEYKEKTKTWRKEHDPFIKYAQKDLFSLEQGGKLVWDEYTDHQIKTIAKLIKGKIASELEIKDEKTAEIHYQIPPQLITGHMAIALGRKTDPGPRLFIKLNEEGIGPWPDESLSSSIEDEIKEIIIKKGIDYKWLQDNLKTWGYKVESTDKLDEQTQNAVRAFQMQFEPENYSGVPSVKTISILEALIKKYYPAQRSDYPRSFDLNEKEQTSFFAKVNPKPDADNTPSTHCCVIS